LIATSARSTLGLLFGLAVWWGFSEPYNRFLAYLTEPLLRIAEPATRLIPSEGEMTIDRTDFRSGSPRPALATSELTVNLVLLAALFAMNRKPLSNANVWAFLIASCILVVVHIAAVITNVESIYALQLGPWSQRHYGTLARNFWGAAAHFYTLVGSFGSAFVLWSTVGPQR
jgi:hypothetical protein